MHYGKGENMIWLFWMYRFLTAPVLISAKKIRQTSKMPIMFLTAADEETDIIMGITAFWKHFVMYLLFYVGFGVAYRFWS